MNWLRAIGSLFARLFSGKTAAAIQKGIEKAAPYVSDALSVATAIAAFTPTRADDEILAVIQRYAVPVIFTPESNRGEVLREIGIAALKKTFPDAPDSALNLALEIAVGAVKAK